MGRSPWFGRLLLRPSSGGALKMQTAHLQALTRGAYFSFQRVAFQDACCACAASLCRLLQQPFEVANEAGTVLVGEGVGSFGAAACAADLLLLMADKELHVDSRLVVDAAAHADG